MEKITHIITLSGNSKRFTEKGYKHKSLCEMNGETTIEKFVKSWGDFNNPRYDNIFLCRDEDLDNLKDEVNKVAPDSSLIGIPKNDGGPVYSIRKIFDKIEDDKPVLISYIDTLQKTSLDEMLTYFEGSDAGMTVHDFQNPHWRTSRSYCLVEADPLMNVTYVQEKYPFTDLDFKNPKMYGSSGNYFFKNGILMKSAFLYLMGNDIRVNNEFYVTQAVEAMVEEGQSVKSYLCPYAALGVPEDLEDYAFWERWHDKNIS